ncbi:hypothetical protein NT239_05920 [Chitinibacter sp. SCUT-21]|uniref:hypothetical protein n=1 Tax=Chitinibacter sp. SCUT-21 TaxID=2970891 RepID=UPI0035A6EB66
MKYLIGLVMAFALSVQVYARQMPMEQTPRVLFAESMGASVEAEKVTPIFVAAANKFGWVVIANEVGKMTLQYNKGNGKHVVTVAVEYDTKAYQIKYVDSINMNYEVIDGVAQIHPNYNRWVFNLNKEINNLMHAR